MRILGLSAFHCDSAAVLLVDGVPLAAAQEGWFTRREPESAFPRRAARECLRTAGLRADELDHVVLCRKPLLEFERVLVSHLRAFPRSARGFSRSMFLWLGDRLWMRHRVASELEIPFERVRFVPHAHALCAAAFHQSPFDEAASLCLDGAGEWTTVSLGRSGPAGLTVELELEHPHSLVHFTAAVARTIGLDPERDLRRLEGLAGEGEPRFLAPLAALIPAAADGSFALAAGALALDGEGGARGGIELERVLGPTREPGSSPGEIERDIAASLQHLLEERVLALAHELARRTGLSRVCLAGEPFTNGRLLARLAEDGPFEALFAPPAPAGPAAALGAALCVAREEGAEMRALSPLWSGVFAAAPADGADEPLPKGVVARDLAAADALRAELVTRLGAGHTLAWMRGAPEWGAAGRGRRSVLRSAADQGAREDLCNALGLAPAGQVATVLVPAERWEEFVEPVPAARHLTQLGFTPRARAALLEAAPSAVAADGRAAVRAVEREHDPELHALLESLGSASGAPLLLEAPFAQRGSAPALGAAEALEAWRRTRVGALVIERRLYEEG